MALVLVKEDGTGKLDANCYADVADGDAYHEGHAWASAWTAATSSQRAAALVMATRLIDVCFEFHGWKTTGGQALQWPRMGCPDRDAAWGGVAVWRWFRGGDCFPGTAVPRCVVDACCEQARELIIADRTGAPLGEGLILSRVGDSEMRFDRLGRAPMLSHVTIGLLRKVGVHVGTDGGVVRLVRC